MSAATNAQASFHAQNQFRDRVSSDITLIESCWWDGEEVECPNRHYDVARLYDGPLTDTPFVMFGFPAKGSVSGECDYIIRTVIEEHELVIER